MLRTEVHSMPSFQGSGPNHVEFGEPDFSGGKVKNRVSTEGTPSGASPTPTSYTVTLRYAFGKDAAEAMANLKSPSAITLYDGLLSNPMEFEHEDVPGTGGYALEILVKNPDGSLHDRLRRAWGVVTAGAGIRSPGTEPVIATGFEARLILPASGFQPWFVWRPEAAGGFVRSPVADMATLNKLWKSSTEIDQVQSKIFGALAQAPAQYAIGAGSVLCRASATKAYLIVAPSWDAVGLTAATKFQFSTPASFAYCGFDLLKLVDSSALAWPAGKSLAAIPEGSPIDYSDAVILSS